MIVFFLLQNKVNCTRYTKYLYEILYWIFPRTFFINPLTPELNPSAQRCLRYLLGILLLEPYISIIYALKPNKCNNYLFSLLTIYGISYMFRPAETGRWYHT
jgi:hypothetical protein